MDTHQQSVQRGNSVVNYIPTISRKKVRITNLEYNLSHLRQLRLFTCELTVPDKKAHNYITSSA